MERRGLDRRRPAFWIWAAVAALAVAGGIVLGLYFTGEPSFCSSCHEMRPEVNGWRAGSHSEVSCFACHSNPGLLGYFKAHVVDGLRDVWVHFTQHPQKIVPTGEIVPPSRCEACHSLHPKGKAPPFPTAPEFPDHPDMKSDCAECHRDQIHGPPP